MSDAIGIDFGGDPVSAAARTNRAIIMMMGQAIAHLESLGWHRENDMIGIVVQEDVFPTILMMRGQEVYRVDLESREDGIITIAGSWTKQPGKKRFWHRRKWRHA